jgi:hypothetical protein
MYTFSHPSFRIAAPASDFPPTQPTVPCLNLTEDQIQGIHNAIKKSRTSEPDSAGILQGVRRIRKGKPHVRVRLYPSPKNSPPKKSSYYIPCEGRPESHMARNLEIDPEIVAYRSQPFRVPSYSPQPLVPDFVAWHPNLTFTVIDVKPAGKLLDPRVQERLQRTRSALRQSRIHHVVVTEEELRAEPTASIRKALSKGARIQLDRNQRHELLEPLHQRPMTVAELKAHAKRLGLDPMAVEKLALLCDITFPINKTWSETSSLEVNHANTHQHSAERGTVRAVRIALRGHHGPQQ